MGDAENIDKALPYLLPEQREDVAKLEKRLIEENKMGCCLPMAQVQAKHLQV